MKSLKRNILISIIALTVIGDVGLFYAAIRGSRLGLRTVTLSDMISTAEAVGTAVNTQINEKHEFLHNISYLEEIKSPDTTLREKQNILDSIANENTLKGTSMMGLNIADADGNCYVRESGIESFKNREYFYKAIGGEDWVYGPMVNKVTNKNTVFISAPMYTNGKPSHVVFQAMTGDFLCDITKRTKIGTTGYSLIIDRTSGNIIGSPNVEDVENEENLGYYAKEHEIEDLYEMYKDCLLGNEGSGIYNDSGVKKLMVYTPIANTNWSAVVIADNKEFISKLKHMENILFGISAALIVIGLIVGILISRSLNPLSKVGLAIKDIASGNADLTQRLDIKKPAKEIADVVNGFNDFVAKMNEIVSSLKCSEENLNDVDIKLQESTQDSVSAITQIIANIQNINNQISNQSNSVTETASAVNEISANIESLEHMIENQSYGVSQASSAVEEMVQNISSVNTSVDKMVSAFSELEQNADIGIKTQADVNAIIKEIDEQSKTLQAANAAISSIASQTNLLAMNAAIEAAHAGDAGKGFSVVSDEIRKLSETSSRESKTIGEELQKVQASIQNVVSVSSKATTAFTNVSSSIHNTDLIIQQIKGAMEEQQVGSQQIITALHSMNDSTLEVKSASNEMGNGNKLILSQVENLQSVTDVINGSITEMLTGAEQIHQTGATLSDISGEVTRSIQEIGNQINQFKV